MKAFLTALFLLLGVAAPASAEPLSLRTGVLANGMHYALLRSTLKPNSLAVRFRIAGGAGAEGPREQGHAHLIEHLVFHGTANIPEGGLQMMLAQQGLRRWSDFNAVTSYEDTIYRLDLARSDARAQETALVLMREIATNLRFGLKTRTDARKDVLAEIAARDAAGDRREAALNAFLLPGTVMARGPVTGTPASVRHASAASLRRLYRRTYRPQHAMLVIVGDFDPKAAETEIARRFGDWSGEGADPDAAASPTPPEPESSYHLFVDREAPTRVTIAAVTEPGAGSREERSAHFLQYLGSEMLQRRLGAGAEAAVYDPIATARLAYLDVTAPDRDWCGALGRASSVLRDALDQGFSQAELDAEIDASRRRLLTQAPPPSLEALADSLVESLARGTSFAGLPDPAETDAYFASVRLDALNAAFRAAWTGSSPRIFLSQDRPIADAETRLGLWAQRWAASGTKLSAGNKEGPAGCPF